MKFTQKIIKSFLPKESTRQALKMIGFEKKTGIFTATDGHKIIQWKDDETAELLPKDCCIPLDCFPENDKSTSRISLVEFEGKEMFKVESSTNEVAYYNYTEEYYPNVEAIMGCGKKRSIDQITLNFSLIKHFETLQKQYPRTKLIFSGEHNPVFVVPDQDCVSFDSDDNIIFSDTWDWRGAFMPMRQS